MPNEIDLLKNKISSELRKYRAEKGYNQSKLSKLAGVNIGTIVRYEKGTVVQNLDKLSKILSVYNIQLDIFFKTIYENMYRN